MVSAPSCEIRKPSLDEEPTISYKFNMTSSFNFDLNEDIKLAVEVEKHPCLYNRFDVLYKKEPQCNKAWEAVGDALGLDKELSLRKFINLKKRYSKKRNAVCKASNPAAIERAERNLDNYSFLHWLDPHIRAKTISLQQAMSMAVQNTDYVESKRPQSTQSDDESEAEQGGSEEREEKQGQEHRKLLKAITPLLKSNKVVAKSPAAEEGYFSAEHPVPVASFIESDKQNESNTQKRNADQAFGNMVAAELTSFPQSTKCCVKHEINEILFKYHKAENERQSAAFQVTP